MSYDFLLFGEALVDDFADGPVVGGAPLNVARHLAGLGASALLVSRLGADPAGELIRQQCQRFGLTTLGLQRDAGHGSGFVTISMAADGSHRFEILPQRAYDFIDAEQACAAARQLAPRATLYHGSLAQRAATSRHALTSLLTRTDATVYCDLNWREGQSGFEAVRDSLIAADSVKLNEQELQQLLDWFGLDVPALLAPPQEGHQPAATAAMMKCLSAAQLIVTFGDKGSALFDPEGRCTTAAAAAPLKHYADTVGAGDAFSAVMMLAAQLGWPAAISLVRAGEFAAAICGLRGAAPERLDFYAPWRQLWSLPDPHLRQAAPVRA